MKSLKTIYNIEKFSNICKDILHIFFLFVYNNIVMIDNYTFHQTLDLKHLKSGIYHFQIKQKSVKYSKNILKL